MNLPLNIDFTDKVVVITGAGGVICSTMARAFAQAGAKVAALNRSGDKVKKLAEELKAEGYICEGYTANVLDKEMLEQVHQQVLKDLGPCDILINGAGGNDPSATADDEYFSMETLLDPDKKSFFDLKGEAFSKVFSLNILGVVLPTQAFVRDMVERGSGCILNISSMNAFTPLTKIPAYSAAKSGVSNFTEWLAVHFAKSGIRCNAIAPGFFVGKQNHSLLFHPDGSPTERTKKILAATPMGRFGNVDELIGAMLFLCDDRCSGFISGVVIPVDGGFQAFGGV